MSNENKAKITYLTQKLCIAVKTTRAEWHADGLKPIDEVLQRATKKLEAEKVAGNIIDFVINEKALTEAWERLSLLDPKSTHDVYLPFAYGIKDFTNVTLEKASSAGICCLITIKATAEEIKTWNLTVLSNFIKYKVLQNQWGEVEPDQAQLKELLAIVLKGVKVERVPVSGRILARAKAVAQAPAAKPSKPAAAPSQAAASSSDTKTAAAPALQNAVLENIVLPDEYPGKGWLQIQTHPDKMSAEVTEFDVELYTDNLAILDETWLKREIKRHGIAISNPELLGRALIQLRGKKPLKGLKIAQGVEGICAANPCLQPVPPKAVENKPGEGDASLRQTKAIPFYRKGDVVAQITYKTPERAGLDIFGSLLPPPPPPPFKAELGEGIQQSGDSAFEALRDGILKVETNKLDIIQTYIHQGNVSIASGNLEFDGGIIVTGDIESGCTVMALGDLEVHGSIRAANVRCYGSLKVNGGINTGMKAAIRSGGGVTADYIENSVIYCKEDIRVRRAILSSNVFCGGSIILSNSDAQLAGGEIFVQKQISTASIGFLKGAATRVHMGMNWREAIREHILISRAANLEAYVEKYKGELREVMRKNPGQMTPKHRAILDTHKLRITTGRRIIDRINERLKVLHTTSKINEAAIVIVRRELAGDVKFMIHGTWVPGDDSLSEFTVRMKAVNNTYFSKIKLASEGKKDKKPAAQAGADKKSA